MALREVNFDGIVGPTHNYAGLAYGNLASAAHRGNVSRPRAAALQGLHKMKALMELGLLQGVLPPLERPDVATLRTLGFAGDDAAVLYTVAREAPSLLAACSSVSSMWTANAATFVPARDAADGRPHFVPANLATSFHRSIETVHTARHLERIFCPSRFVHHRPLPAHPQFGDEGAANHTRLTTESGEGVHVFVYGRSAGSPVAPVKYPARQTREASEAVARLAGLSPSRAVFVQQRPDAVDAGVFHNDVIAVGHEHVLLVHEDAFQETDALLGAVRHSVGKVFVPLVVRRDELTVAEAVETYLFNSQLVTRADGNMTLVAPADVEAHPRARAVVERLLTGAGPISEVMYFDLRESMRNGGGPACLRLRVALDDVDLAHVAPHCLLTQERFDELVAWVTRHYREELRPEDLGDPALLGEVRNALDALTHILRLPRLYPFQQ